MAHRVKSLRHGAFVREFREVHTEKGELVYRHITTTRDPGKAALLSDDQAVRLCDRSFEGDDLTGAAGAARRVWERVNT